ncbi:MAG: MerR family transcriptional regulator [Dehalococcoidia bacterium]|nr:MerR family transcriptional regulator [Dehalococcoidia bacterium]
MARQGYTTNQACQMVGVTYRHLDYWARTGLISPSVKAARGRGSPRLYSFSDLVSLTVVKRLKDSGISIRSIRKSLGFVKANLSSARGSLADLPLLTNGKTVFVVDGEGRRPIDTLRGGQMTFALTMDDIVNDLRSRLPSLDDGGSKREKHG